MVSDLSQNGYGREREREREIEREREREIERETHTNKHSHVHMDAHARGCIQRHASARSCLCVPARSCAHSPVRVPECRVEAWLVASILARAFAAATSSLGSVTKASFEYHQPPGSPEQRVSVVSASLAVLLHHRQEGSRSQVSQPWLSAWHFCHSGSLL